MKNEKIKALVEYRVEQAEESLKAAELLVSAGLVRPVGKQGILCDVLCGSCFTCFPQKRNLQT